MSMYVHRCRQCGHDAQAHDQRLARCSAGMCKCAVSKATFGDPELIPTFDPVSGERLDRVLQPGSSLAPGVLACSCDACVAAADRS